MTELIMGVGVNERELELAWQRKVIAKARDGDTKSAWLALKAAIPELERGDPAPLLVYMADFVQALLDISDGVKAPTRKQLSEALDSLHIVSKRGRPGIPEDELVGRLAAERLEVAKAGSVAGGRARLQTGKYGLGDLRQRDLHTERPDLVRLVDMASEAECEGLADNLKVENK